MVKKIKAYGLTKKEKDTYDLKKRKEKETFSENKILEHWDTRANRYGIQGVMSARHAYKENIEATKNLQKEMLRFLKGRIENKNIFELGFGVGRMSKLLSKKAKNIVGCDISPTMLKKAMRNLRGIKNIELHLGKITSLNLESKSFDLVFDSIVLLHILNKNELKKTINKMKELSNHIFVCEHTYEGPNFPISKYSILRKPEEYKKLFRPYRLIKQKTHFCAGDRFTLMLFKK